MPHKPIKTAELMRLAGQGARLRVPESEPPPDHRPVLEAIAAALQQEQPQPEPPDMTPVVQAIEALATAIRNKKGGSISLGRLTEPLRQLVENTRPVRRKLVALNVKRDGRGRLERIEPEYEESV